MFYILLSIYAFGVFACVLKSKLIVRKLVAMERENHPDRNVFHEIYLREKARRCFMLSFCWPIALCFYIVFFGSIVLFGIMTLLYEKFNLEN